MYVWGVNTEWLTWELKLRFKHTRARHKHVNQIHMYTLANFICNNYIDTYIIIIIIYIIIHIHICIHTCTHTDSYFSTTVEASSQGCNPNSPSPEEGPRTNPSATTFPLVCRSGRSRRNGSVARMQIYKLLQLLHYV